MRLALVFTIALTCLGADERTLTLREAVDLALKQNPDLALARLDERKAEEAVRLAKDPFVPKAIVGSGLAYSSGMPMSVEGSTPSLFTARGVGSIIDRPQSYRVAAARESRRGAVLDTAVKQEEVTLRTAQLFVDAENAARALGVVRREIESLERVRDSVSARVAEGRELPIEQKRAELALARARHRVRALENSLAASQDALAAVVGLDAGARVRVTPAERPAPALPASPDTAVQTAMANSKEVRALESKIVAKGLDVRSARAGWLPKVDLVAQYALLSKFNNYEDFFNRFERHNGQIGVSFSFPVWAGPGIKAQASQAEAESAQLKIQLRNTRRRIEDEVRRAYAGIAEAESLQQVARLDLDVAREQVSVLLAQSEEGRASLRQLEEARMVETDKWIAFHDAGAAAEKARMQLLRHTGELAAALQ